MKLETTISGIKIDPCIMNASGPLCTYKKELVELAESNTGAVVFKSGTILYRKGNPEPRLIQFGNDLIQAMGLPNLGYKKYAEYIPELKEYGKPIIPSVAGFNIEEYVLMSKAYENAGADMLELNLSCPNVGKRLICYDPEKTKEVVSEVKNETKIPISVKLGPYTDPFLLKEIAEALKEVDCITLINSPSGATKIDPISGKILLKPEYGGLSGKSIKPLAVGNVRKFHKLIDKPIIGVGGIFTAEDVIEYARAGASAMQIGTCYLQRGPKIFEEISKNLEKFLEVNNFESISSLISLAEV